MPGFILLLKNAIMNKMIPGYTLTFCLKKPVDIDVNNYLFVIQAHERGCGNSQDWPKGGVVSHIMNVLTKSEKHAELATL